MKLRGDEVTIVNQQKKEEHKDDDVEKDTSFHSEEIIENLDSVNMDPWYYIYGKYVNPELDKKNRKTIFYEYFLTNIAHSANFIVDNFFGIIY